MARDYREAHLEEWLFNNPNLFEKEVRWLSRQRDVFWNGEKIGKTDLQGIDVNKNIIIIELKAQELNHRDLSQALCYWRSVSTHSGQSDPRLIFIGTKMSTRFRIVFEWLQEICDIKMEVYFYEKEGESYFFRKYDKEVEESFCVPLFL